MLKRGVSPYHVCYVVDNLFMAYEEMADNVFKPLSAPAYI